MTGPPPSTDPLAVLCWSTSQGDAAVAGALAERLTDNPYPPASTLRRPWTAGWVAGEAARQAPEALDTRKAAGSEQASMKAAAVGARIGVMIDRALRPQAG